MSQKTAQIKREITVNGATITKTVEKTAGSSTSIEESISANSTDLEITLAVDVSAVKWFYMLADQAMTIETNSGSAPDNTIALAANQPYEWMHGDPSVFKLTVDVTAIFVTNTTAGTLQIEVGQDPTP